MSQPDIARVRDIMGCIEAIDRAEATAHRYPDDLEVSRVALDAVRHSVSTIGETVRSLSLDLREDHPAVAWSDMANLSALIDRHQRELDSQIMRSTIAEPIRGLRSACRAILAESVRIGEDQP